MYNILCVDDTHANLFILESLFESYSSKYKIITASSGEKALEVLLSNKIDLILLDVMMPYLDGFETAKLIKANTKTKDIPIIFITAKKDHETIKSSFTYGVDYLSKPYDESELFTRIEVQIDHIEMNRKLEEQLSFNQAILDSSKNILFIQDDFGVVSVNKSFLDFFQVKNVEEFNKNHDNIMELFMEYENFFSKHILNDGQSWLNKLSYNKNKEYNILIMNPSIFEPNAFQIYVTPMENSDKFVVTLSDVTKLTTKSKVFENKATYDSLTNVFNRSKFNDVFNLEYQTAKQNNHPLSFAIMDIDFFKKVNDNYGHIIGDETLIKFAQTIQNKISRTDTFARWGGEEFVIALSGLDIDAAFPIVDSLREEIQNTVFKEIGSVTCSIGLTELRENDTIDEILIRSDEALYEAKQNGRNKVCTK